MASKDQFLQTVNAGYKFSTESVKTGVGTLSGTVVEDCGCGFTGQIARSLLGILGLGGRRK